MIRRELPIFLIVGSLAVLVDSATYSGLVSAAVVSVDVAKASSFLVGTVFAYFANRIWTFGHTSHRPGSPWRFGFLYMVTLGTNVVANALMLKLLGEARAAILLAFVVATGVSASLNFLGMKRFVFRPAVVAGSRWTVR